MTGKMGEEGLVGKKAEESRNREHIPYVFLVESLIVSF